MPNWAYTSYRIVGKKEEVQDLYSKIQQFQNMEEPLEPNGFGNLWLGCLLTILGGDWEKVYCRGKIIDFSLDDGVLSINTETAGQKCKKFANSFNKITPHLKSSTMKKNLDGVSIKPMIMINDSFPSAISLMIWKEMDQNIMMTLIHCLKLHLKFSVRS